MINRRPAYILFTKKTKRSRRKIGFAIFVRGNIHIRATVHRNRKGKGFEYTKKI